MPALATRWTFGPEETCIAFFVVGDADCAAQGDDVDVPEYPVILGKKLHQFEFDLHGIVGFGEAEFAADTFYVGINYYAWYVIDVAADYIGGLKHRCWSV